jgi:hypothetical protein
MEARMSMTATGLRLTPKPDPSHPSNRSHPSAPMLRRICAWCDRELDPVPCEPAMAGAVSHSICEKCARERFGDSASEISNFKS